MIEAYHNLKNYLFPVFIYKDTEVLTIEDGRPGEMQVFFFVGGIGILGFGLFFLLKLIEAGLFLLLAGIIVAATALIVKALLQPFRSTYVFDKRTDTYSFTRRSLFKSETEQGALSQFRGVQIERKIVSTDDGSTEKYSVALLKNEGLLFGTPSTQILRGEGDSHPIFSNYSSELRIAQAIAEFLNFRSPDVVDTL